MNNNLDWIGIGLVVLIIGLVIYSACGDREVYVKEKTSCEAKGGVYFAPKGASICFRSEQVIK